MKIQTPLLAVDVIIESPQGIVLIERKNPPAGWALPGGFVDVGETVEQAAIREAQEETSLQVFLTELLWLYSHPQRDPRGHTVSVVFIATAKNFSMQAQDDAQSAGFFLQDNLPKPLAFDHQKILQDYFHFKKTKQKPLPQVDKDKRK